MKVLNSLSKHAHLMMAVCLALGIVSCSNEEEIVSQSNNNGSPEVEVSRMSDWLPDTRSTPDGLADMPVLHFQNEQAYNQTIEKLSNMTKEDRDTYFEKLRFDGAYTLWNRADEELDQIFNTENTLRIEKLINDYKVKYGNVFSFNTYGKEVSILNLRIETVSNVFDANVENFTSSHGKTVGRQAFKNIKVI